jgi:hypothetical protein
MPLIPSFASTTLKSVSNRDKFAYTPFIFTGTGQATTTFAYHVGVHLENFSQGLDNDRDCHGATNDSSFTLVGATTTCAYYPSTDIWGGYNQQAAFIAMFATLVPVPSQNWYTGMMPGYDFTTNLGAGNVNDFDGMDNDTTKCNATTDCVFDLTAQQ